MQAQCMSVFNFFLGYNCHRSDNVNEYPSLWNKFFVRVCIRNKIYAVALWNLYSFFSCDVDIVLLYEIIVILSSFVPPRQWRSRLERYWPRKRKVGCLNPSHDRPMSFKQVVTTLGNRRECHRSSEMTIMNGCPVSQQVWRAKEPSMLSGHKCRAQVNICSLSPVMMTSPYE